MLQSATQLAALRFAEDKIRKAISEGTESLSLEADGAINECDDWFMHGHDELEELSALPDLSGLAWLKVLDISFTKIRSVEGVSCLPELEELYLCECPVSSANPVGSNSSLKVLDIRSTKISDLLFARKNLSLEYLNLSSSAVHSLSGIERCVWLKRLYIENCGINELPVFGKHRQLSHIGLANCPIEDFSPLNGVEQLNWLHIDDTQIETLLREEISESVRVDLTVNKWRVLAIGLSVSKLRKFLENPNRAYLTKLTARE